MIVGSTPLFAPVFALYFNVFLYVLNDRELGQVYNNYFIGLTFFYACILLVTVQVVVLPFWLYILTNEQHTHGIPSYGGTPKDGRKGVSILAII